MRNPEIGNHLDGTLCLVFCLIDPSGKKQGPCIIEFSGRRQRLDFQSAFYFGYGFIKFAEAGESKSIQAVRLARIWIEFEGPFGLAFPTSQIVILQEHE